MLNKLKITLMILGVSFGIITMTAIKAEAQSGSKIAFASNRDGDFEIFVMDEDGSNPINLTNSAGGDSAPAFSPPVCGPFLAQRDSGFQ